MVADALIAQVEKPSAPEVSLGQVYTLPPQRAENVGVLRFCANDFYF